MSTSINLTASCFSGIMFFKMKIHMLECEDCGTKWTISGFFLDDGEEIYCPHCGSEAYREDATDDVEEYAPLKNALGWGNG